MKRLQNFFEDPENPSMGGTINFCKLFLLWAPSRPKYQTTTYYVVLFLSSMLLLVQFIKLSIERQPYMFSAFLQFSCYHLGVVKIITFEVYHRKWEKIVQWISDMERQAMADPKYKTTIEQYKKHGRNIIIYFWILGIICNTVYFLQYWFFHIKDIEFDGNLKIKEKAYYFFWPSLDSKFSTYLYMCLESLYGHVTCFYVLAWDALCMSVLVAFAGQLKVIGERFNQALDAEAVADQKKNLIDCYKHYTSLIEAQKNCNDFLSPALFCHLLMISVNLSVIITNMSTYSRTEILTFTLFLSALLMETSMYYWHGNEVMVQSELISYSVFQSSWVDKSLEVRRLVLQMTETTTKRLLFSAGPFNYVTLSTSIGILRATYSFYTLMDKTN